MKKLLWLSMTICLFLSGCEKEGVYNPSKKIKRVYYQKVNDVKRLAAEWTWEKNHLGKVQFFYSNGKPSYDNRYTYEKNRLVKIEATTWHYLKITYLDNQYDKAEEYAPLIVSSTKYTYENDKVSKIVETVFRNNGKSLEQDRKLIYSLLPPELVRELNKMDSRSKGNPTETIAKIVTIKWDKNNISEVIMEQYQGEITQKIITTYKKYDNKENPLLHSAFAIIGSKNNPLELMVKYEEIFSGEIIYSVNSAVTYEYEYEGKFPTQIIETEKGDNGYYGVSTTFYEYK